MIAYVTLGTNDPERALAFYDPLLTRLGAVRSFDHVRGHGWGRPGEKPFLYLVTPFDRATADTGNGTMVALQAGTRDRVDALHALALALGGTDEGAPGPRVPPNYGAYFRDPEGHKICLFCVLPAG